MNKDASDVLFQFFAAYFNEDWPYDASTPDEIIDRYIPMHPREQRLHLAGLIEMFIAERDDDSLKRALFEELACYYVPEADGQVRSWMEHVARRLRS